MSVSFACGFAAAIGLVCLWDWFDSFGDVRAFLRPVCWLRGHVFSWRSGLRSDDRHLTESWACDRCCCRFTARYAWPEE